MVAVSLVHDKWLTPKKKHVWWPPYKQEHNLSKALKKGESPVEETWCIYEMNRKLFEEETYQKATRKLKLSEFLSDVPSETEIEEPPSKRKVKQPQRFLSSESESDNDQKYTKLPLPPKISLGTLNETTRKPHHHHLLQLMRTQKICSENNSIILLTPKTSLSIVNKETSQKHLSSSFTSTTKNTHKICSENNSDVTKKTLSILIQIREQNNQILNLLKTNQTSAAIQSLELPDDFPVTLPLHMFRILKF